MKAIHNVIRQNGTKSVVYINCNVKNFTVDERLMFENEHLKALICEKDKELKLLRTLLSRING